MARAKGMDEWSKNKQGTHVGPHDGDAMHGLLGIEHVAVVELLERVRLLEERVAPLDAGRVLERIHSVWLEQPIKHLVRLQLPNPERVDALCWRRVSATGLQFCGLT